MSRRPFSNWTSTDWARVSIVLLGVTWFPSMSKSLWVDELGTFWAVSGSLSEAVARAPQANQSPFTFVLMWAWNQALSPSDFGLRVLPVLFGVATLLVLFSIGKRLGGSAVGWYAVAAVGAMYEMRAMVVNFRPYAFALFFFALSTRLLLAWDDRPTTRNAAGYVLATAATVWSVFYFGLPLLGHVVYILVRRKEGSESSLKGFASMAGGAVFLCLPLVPQLLTLAGRADTLQFSGIPMMRAVIGGLIPIGMAGTWLIVMLVSGVPGRWVGRRSELILIGWLAVAPTAMLYLLTVFSDFGLWTVRYRSVFLLGFGLAVAVWIAGYAEERLKVRAVLVVMVVGLLVSPPQDFASEQDWRSGLGMAESSIGADGLVILGSGLVEAASLASLEDAQLSRFIAAPLSRYPVRQSVLLAPLLPAGEAFPYLVDKLRGAPYAELAVASLVGDPPGYDTFYLALEPLGFRQVESEIFGRVQVIVYRRD